LAFPIVQPFSLDDRAKRDLGGALGLTALPDEISGAIEAAISTYKATEAGSRDTTVKNTLVALDELKKTGRTYEKAVARLADDRSGVDYTTHSALQDLAKAEMRREPGAREALNKAATEQAARLRDHERVNTKTESLRFFCGVLRLIFNHAAADSVRQTPEKAWHYAGDLRWRSSQQPTSRPRISSLILSG
jgi:hypothetical protein